MALLGGTTLASGLGSFFSGRESAKTSREAAQLQYQLQKQAMEQAQAAGNKFQGDVTNYAQAYNPYVQSGGAANDRLMSLLGLGGDGASPTDVYRQTPGYDFLQGQGVQALDRSAAARGMLGSGRQSKDLIRFGQGLADTTANNYMNQLQPLVNRGYNATGAQTNTLVQGAQGNLGANTSAANMGFQSANTIPQGMVAGQNAENAGLTGALGALNYGVGQYNAQNTLQSLLGKTGRTTSYSPQFSGSLPWPT